MTEALREAVTRQRLLLHGRLALPLQRLAGDCARHWPHRRPLERVLVDAFPVLPSCKYLYCLDADTHQITANCTRDGLDESHLGRNRCARPYMIDALAGHRFTLSQAYISRNARRPSLTAIQHIRSPEGQLLGYLGADFDLRELPLTRELYQQPVRWMQLRGDPAIRGGLFHQERVESLMDAHIDAVLDLFTELVAAHGVFHGKLHFSSSRATLWLMDDPYRYRILDSEDLTDPAICLAYPTRPYPEDALIPLARVREIVQTFRELRLMDETIYLRSGSLNIFNGIVGLNFSCDGSHYMPWNELLKKSLGFWLGTGDTQAIDPTTT